MIYRYNMYPSAPVNGDPGRRREFRRGHRADGRRGPARTSRSRHARRMDRTGHAAAADRQYGHAGVRAGRGAGVPRAGRAVRKLVAAAGRDPGGADVPALLDRRRDRGAHGRQHLHAGRLRGAGRAWPARTPF